MYHTSSNELICLQDFIPKLKAHLAPRLQALLEEEAKHRDGDGLSLESRSVSGPLDCNYLFFKSGRMYEHHLLRINYTTYDVRRSQNVINPGTSHRDVMLLANDNETNHNSHPYWFARVIGIYHVNVVYTGPRMFDYIPRRLDFLWVQWFQFEKSKPFLWEECELDRVSFPPMARDDAFGFLAPEDVLRGCHIMPAFTVGPVHANKVSLSRCAGDSHDWKQYFINRYAPSTSSHTSTHRHSDSLTVIWSCVTIADSQRAIPMHIIDLQAKYQHYAAPREAWSLQMAMNLTNLMDMKETLYWEMGSLNTP
jgi:hypothetical protein